MFLVVCGVIKPSAGCLVPTDKGFNTHAVCFVNLNESHPRAAHSRDDNAQPQRGAQRISDTKHAIEYAYYTVRECVHVRYCGRALYAVKGVICKVFRRQSRVSVYQQKNLQ
jgi:hypothetical protein